MSAKIKAIKNLYRHGRITKEQLKNSVPTVITTEEYKEITGEDYIYASYKNFPLLNWRGEASFYLSET